MSTAEMEYIAKRAARLMKLGGTPRMIVKNVRRGRAHPRDGYFTIPQWAISRHPAYLAAYIIHELAHFQPNRYFIGHGRWYLRGHGPELWRIEADVAEAFGYRLHRFGDCYPKQISCSRTKRVLCGPHGVWSQAEKDWAAEMMECQHPACLI